jgi:beta-phosphoglucomutase-like phosphatase (HAD superfamily)
MAVATSTDTSRAEQKLAEAGLRRHLHAVVGGDQIERSKPEPDIYLRAACLLGAQPSVCLALEDSENGVRAAVAAGMTVVQIPDLIAPPALPTPPRIVLRSLEDVAGYQFGRSGE